MSLLGIDIGTTNCKAGLFREDGSAIRIVSRPTAASRDDQGNSFYEPEKLWRTVADCIRSAIAGCEAASGFEQVQATNTSGGNDGIAAAGIAGMAESGLLVDAVTGEARTPVIPWFDRRAAGEADFIAGEDDPLARFQASGLHCSCKYGLAKLLWLRKRDPDLVRGAVWMSAADYVAYRLTGTMATDYSLAGRTFAFDIRSKTWDERWIRHFGLEPSLFPRALPAGTIVGSAAGGGAAVAGLVEGVPVAIAGHDHVAAALAVGAMRPGDVYDSMGTAETLVGIMRERPLAQADFDSGLSYGLHSAAGRAFWMGGAPASGGSVEWMRGILGERAPLGYEEIASLLGEAAPEPTGIVYFPYLSGSGAPRPDANMSGAFVGLRAGHGRPELLKASLEGVAFEMEAIRRAAIRSVGAATSRIIAVGGGTRLEAWMNVKADISGCTVVVPAVDEATLLGAALTAGIGAGIYGSAEAAAAAIGAAGGESGFERCDSGGGGMDDERFGRWQPAGGAPDSGAHEAKSAGPAIHGGTLSLRCYEPDMERHTVYRDLFERIYMPLQQPLRDARTGG